MARLFTHRLKKKILPELASECTTIVDPRPESTKQWHTHRTPYQQHQIHKHTLPPNSWKVLYLCKNYQNTFLQLAYHYAKDLNISKCWVCFNIPLHSSEGVIMLPIACNLSVKQPIWKTLKAEIPCPRPQMGTDPSWSNRDMHDIQLLPITWD